MDDIEYATKRKALESALAVVADTADEVTAEAIARDEGYVLHAWYYHCETEWPYLTLAEAVDRAQDDCSPIGIVGPGGKRYDPFTGDPEKEPTS